MYFDPTPQALRLLREDLDLSRPRAEEKAGVPQGSLSRWEIGKPSPSRKNLEKYLKGLGCPREEFARFQHRALCDEFGFAGDLHVEYAFRRRIERARELLDASSPRFQHGMDKLLKNFLRELESSWESCIVKVEEIERTLECMSNTGDS